jgi:hypothetical protein
MRDLDLLIRQAIAKSDKDQYGQCVTRHTTIYGLFRNEGDEFRAEIEAHLKSGNSKYILQCYGGSLGVFYAINPCPKKY